VAHVTLPDAGIPDAPPAPIDAGVAIATRSDTKKDAPSERSVHPATQKTGLLSVKAFPIMTVNVDKKRYGDTPQNIKLSVGTHRIELTNAELGTDISETVNITENHTTYIDKTK
ncbi:MAG TPA: PEGA domain-containing protein, partial [Kofleriaceae bacterium]